MPGRSTHTGSHTAGIDIGAREIFVFSDFTEDLAENGSIVGKLWGHHGGDGIHLGVLDSALRCARTTRCEALFGGRPWHERRARAPHRLARMPMAAVSAFGRIAPGGISTGRGCMRSAVVDAASQRSGADGLSTYIQHMHIQHMHKALTQMNLQIHHAISDMGGLTGLAIVDAIV
jgi:hypothetical protein